MWGTNGFANIWGTTHDKEPSLWNELISMMLRMTLSGIKQEICKYYFSMRIYCSSCEKLLLKAEKQYVWETLSK